MLDIDEFTAVINPPEAGILAVGRMVEQPVVHEGAVAIRRRMRLTMSCDHRVIDGATGARFLQTLKGCWRIRWRWSTDNCVKREG